MKVEDVAGRGDTGAGAGEDAEADPEVEVEPARDRPRPPAAASCTWDAVRPGDRPFTAEDRAAAAATAEDSCRGVLVADRVRVTRVEARSPPPSPNRSGEDTMDRVSSRGLLTTGTVPIPVPGVRDRLLLLPLPLPLPEEVAEEVPPEEEGRYPDPSSRLPNSSLPSSSLSTAAPCMGDADRVSNRGLLPAGRVVRTDCRKRRWAVCSCRSLLPSLLQMTPRRSWISALDRWREQG